MLSPPSPPSKEACVIGAASTEKDALGDTLPFSTVLAIGDGGTSTCGASGETCDQRVTTDELSPSTFTVGVSVSSTSALFPLTTPRAGMTICLEPVPVPNDVSSTGLATFPLRVDCADQFGSDASSGTVLDTSFDLWLRLYRTAMIIRIIITATIPPAIAPTGAPSLPDATGMGDASSVGAAVGFEYDGAMVAGLEVVPVEVVETVLVMVVSTGDCVGG